MRRLLDAFDRWLDRHPLAPDRILFWVCTFDDLAATVGIGLALAEHSLGSLVAGVMFVFIWLVNTSIVISCAEDVRYTKERLGLPLRPAWVERLRRWWHIALFGWTP